MISLIKQVQSQYKSSSVYLTWRLGKQKRERKKNQTILQTIWGKLHQQGK